MAARNTGPGAEAWLDRILANRVPRTGRIVLSPMLNPAGKLIGDFTVAKSAPERFLVLGSSAAQIQGGQIRALAVAAPKRVKAFPDLPTAAEAGAPGYEVSTFYALWAPKNTPPDIVERMKRELRVRLRHPTVATGLLA